MSSEYAAGEGLSAPQVTTKRGFYGRNTWQMHRLTVAHLGKVCNFNTEHISKHTQNTHALRIKFNTTHAFITRITAEVRHISHRLRNVFHTVKERNLTKLQILWKIHYFINVEASWRYSHCHTSHIGIIDGLRASNIMTFVPRFMKICPLDQLFLREQYVRTHSLK